MSFIDETVDRYEDLPKVTVTHESEFYVVLNVDNDPMKSIHVLETQMEDGAIYSVASQGQKGSATVSVSRARDIVWATYLDMIDDLA